VEDYLLKNNARTEFKKTLKEKRYDDGNDRPV